MLKRTLSLLLVICLVFSLTGCETFKSKLEKADNLYAKGQYQEAQKLYMEVAQEYQQRMGKDYTSEQSAKEDAAKMVEAYLKAGMTYDKLGDMASAKAFFEKATKDTYSITYGYYVQQDVWVAAGYRQKWIPGGYQEIWIEGKYEEVYVEGKEIYVDGYYKADGTYVDGYYKKSPGHYEQKWVAGHYENKYVDGHYDSVWEPAHYETQNVYKTKPVEIKITSPYIDQARAKLGPSTVTTNTTSPAPAAPVDPRFQAAYDEMVKAYKAWQEKGAPTSGSEFEAYNSAKKAYEALTK